MELDAKLSLDVIRDSNNLAEELSSDDLKKIGMQCYSDYKADEQSRSGWLETMNEANDLALQVSKDKSSPWPGAANVKFPLLSIASLQFHARAYPALVKSPNLVKFRVQGSDETGEKAARAARIGAHMSYQYLDEDEQWEENQDAAFLVLPITGCAFKKTYYKPELGINCSRLVLPKNLVVNYYAKSMDSAQRVTELVPLYQNEIKERELKGIFAEYTQNDGKYPQPQLENPSEEDDRQGIKPPPVDADTPRVFLEQHRLLDLDGDGYKEPYVVTIDKDTKHVARIVARIDSVQTEQALKIEELQSRMRSLAEGLPIQQALAEMPPEAQNQALQNIRNAEQTILAMQEQVRALSEQKPKVLSIKPVQHYTRYLLIPSPDGGFYGLGFGRLMSPLNHSVNTLINQLLDSGTLQNSSSGFIGRGARIKGGKVRFKPFEWQKVDSTGGNLRDSIVPLPVNQPSAVLFQLLSLLINYAERASSVTDAMVGDNPGQNTPAYNMQAMLQQGMQLFNGIFKRLYRSFRSEIRKSYALNAIYLDPQEYFTYQDSENEVHRADYNSDPRHLIPAADPNAFSDQEKMMKAQAVAERAMMVPGYDPIQVEKRILDAMDVTDVDEVFPLVPQKDEQGQDTGAMTYKFPPQPDPEFEIKRQEEQRRTLEAQDRAAIGREEAAAKMMVAEANLIKTMAEVQKMGDDTALKELELRLKDLADRRKAMTEVVKIENQGNAGADSGLDGESGN